MALRHGDEIQLAEPDVADTSTLRFENRMGEAFVPPGASLAAAWMAHPAFRDPEHGPARYGEGRALGGRDPARCRVVSEAGTARRLLVKVLGRVRGAEDGDEHLALLRALAGAPHPSLVPVVDGGLAQGAEGPVRWTATVWVEGISLRERLADEGALEPPAALAVLRDLSAALAWLHGRDVIHRDVSPANVVVTPTGRAVLVDPGQALLVNGAHVPGPGVVGTPGYLAPEAVLAGGAPLTQAVDVYGLAAVGYALFTGRPPATGHDLLEALAQAAAPPTRPRDLGVDLPPPLEAALLSALAPEPRARPSARRFERNLAFAEASLGLGGDA
jgi:serine/threonine-protein kinase